MKYASCALLLLTATIVMASPNWGGTMTVHFTGVGGPSYDGLYTYPYYGTLDGQPETFMCITDEFTIHPGETWQVQAIGPNGAGGLTADAWLFLQARQNHDPLINAAAWWIFDNEYVGIPTGQPAANLVPWVDAANGHVNDRLTGVAVLIPDNWTSTTEPQWFMTSTPEPSSLLLGGSGLLLGASVLRRKLR